MDVQAYDTGDELNKEHMSLKDRDIRIRELMSLIEANESPDNAFAIKKECNRLIIEPTVLLVSDQIIELENMLYEQPDDGRCTPLIANAILECRNLLRLLNEAQNSTENVYMVRSDQQEPEFLKRFYNRTAHILGRLDKHLEAIASNMPEKTDDADSEVTGSIAAWDEEVNQEIAKAATYSWILNFKVPDAKIRSKYSVDHDEEILELLQEMLVDRYQQCHKDAPLKAGKFLCTNGNFEGFVLAGRTIEITYDAEKNIYQFNGENALKDLIHTTFKPTMRESISRGLYRIEDAIIYLSYRIKDIAQYFLFERHKLAERYPKDQGLMHGLAENTAAQRSDDHSDLRNR